MGALDAHTFFRLAYRLKHYRGVMRDVAQVAAEEGPAPAVRPQQARPPAAAPEMNLATKASVQSDALLSSWIGFG